MSDNKLKILFCLVSLLCAPKLLAAESRPFPNIQIQGLKRVSEGAVLQSLPLKKGQALSEKDTEKTIQALYRTGLFQKIQIKVLDDKRWLIDLIEQPVLRSIDIKGLKSTETVQGFLTDSGVLEGAILKPSALKVALQKIEAYYLSQGRYAVQIQSELKEIEPGFVALHLQLFEGDLAKIRSIRILGAKAFPEKTLLAQLNLAPTHFLSWLTRDDRYSREKWQASLDNLRAYYLDRGYLDIKLESNQVSITPDKKAIYLSVSLIEGPQYRIRSAEIEGELPVPKSAFKAALAPLQEGKLFSRKQVMEVKSEIESILGNEGYGFAEVNIIPLMDEKDHRLQLVFEVKPKQKVYVRNLHIRGNQVTQDEVFRRELPQLEAAPYSKKAIQEGKENILRRGFASRVEVDTQKVIDKPDWVDVFYDLEESKVGQLGVGLDYSQAQGLGWNFNWGNENFFGTGKNVQLNFDQNQASTNYQASYFDPYFTVDGIGMGYNLYHNKTQLSKTTATSSYITDTSGMDFQWVFPTGRYHFVKFALGYDNLNLKSQTTAQEIQDFISANGHRFQEWSMGFGLGYNSFDRRLFPRSGASHTFNFRMAMPGSRLSYYRMSEESHYYYPLSQNQYWILHASGTLGYGNGYGKTSQMPFFKHFFAGGSRWVRGFEENDLGPKDSLGNSFGGNALLAGSLGLIFPNPIKPDLESVRTALFFDVGQVYDTKYRRRVLENGETEGRNSCLRYSVGFSLSWNSPMGPIMFSLAKPLNLKAGDKRRGFSLGAATHF